MVRVKAVRVLRDFEIEILFTDGSRRVKDLGPRLHGRLFGQLRDDPALFRQVRVDELGGLVWPNGADICPDVLFLDLEPA
ncbi:MAG: DUF2442 domain-containing protein [Planctomycetota bacterium]|jgi:hypothetical protein